MNGKKGKAVPREALETAIVRHILNDLQSPEFIRALLVAARQHRETLPIDPTTPLRDRIAEIARQVARTMRMAIEMEIPGPALRLVEDLERERAALVAEIARLEQEYQRFQSLAILDESSIARFLSSLADDIEQAGAPLTARGSRMSYKHWSNELVSTLTPYTVKSNTRSIYRQSGIRWRPQGDSNPCYRRERAVSSASRRWGQ